MHSGLREKARHTMDCMYCKVIPELVYMSRGCHATINKDEISTIEHYVKEFLCMATDQCLHTMS